MSDLDVRARFAARYGNLDILAQQRFLIDVGNYLTLVGRETSGLNGDVLDSLRLRAVNEAMHRVLGQLWRLANDDERRYPDDVFANIIVDQYKILALDPERLMPIQERSR